MICPYCAGPLTILRWRMESPMNPIVEQAAEKLREDIEAGMKAFTELTGFDVEVRGNSGSANSTYDKKAIVEPKYRKSIL